MPTNYRRQKDWAFFLILLLGIAYLGLLATLTFRIWPDFTTQLALLASAVRVNCSLPELLSTANQTGTLLLGGMVTVLWLKVSGAGGRFLLSWLKTQMYLHQFVAERQDGEIHVLRSAQPIAFTAGFFRPQVYISSFLVGRLTARELKSVVQHETYHMKSRDPLRKAVVSLVQNMLLPFPFRGNIFASYEVLSELAADEWAAQITGNKLGIVEALDKILMLDEHKLQLAWFGFRHDRISILLGAEVFKTKQFFAAAGFATLVVIANTFLVVNTNLVGSCQEVMSQIHSVVSQAEFLTSSQTAQWCSFVSRPNLFTPNPETGRLQSFIGFE